MENKEWMVVFTCSQCERKQVLGNQAGTAEGMKEIAIELYGDQCEQCGEKWAHIEVSPF
jgi:DNA-directed RNA polymerase subunit RPC12/RpoP